jgi:ABC-type nitrate/sulfonate/bicarbonate transport system substrate-binding protein
VVSAIRTTGIGTAITVPKASPIRGLADLKGRTVANLRRAAPSRHWRTAPSMAATG